MPRQECTLTSALQNEQWEEIFKKARDRCLRLVQRAEAQEVNPKPFTLTRTGGRAKLYVPVSIDPEDPLSAAFVQIASDIPNVVIDVTKSKYTQPTYSSEATKMLTGIAAATLSRPKSFAQNSNPIDMTYLALWSLASSIAVSDPNKAVKVWASVIPRNLGGDDPKRYMMRVFATLKACNPQENGDLIHSLDQLIHLWARSKQDKALELVRSQKIPYAAVLAKGGNWEIKKTKNSEIKRLLVPSKPNTSPWLSNQEKDVITKRFTPEWEVLDQIAKDWKALPAEEQHDSFLTYVKRVRDTYTSLANISSSVNARLGHRKRYVIKALTELGKMPKKKDERSNNFLLNNIFRNQDLTGLKEPVKYEFILPIACEKGQDRANLINYGVALAKTEGAERMKDSQVFKDLLVYQHIMDNWFNKFRPSIQHGMIVDEVEGLVGVNNKFMALEDEVFPSQGNTQ